MSHQYPRFDEYIRKFEDANPLKFRLVRFNSFLCQFEEVAMYLANNDAASCYRTLAVHGLMMCGWAIFDIHMAERKGVPVHMAVIEERERELREKLEIFRERVEYINDESNAVEYRLLSDIMRFHRMEEEMEEEIEGIKNGSYSEEQKVNLLAGARASLFGISSQRRGREQELFDLRKAENKPDPRSTREQVEELLKLKMELLEKRELRAS